MYTSKLITFPSVSAVLTLQYTTRTLHTTVTYQTKMMNMLNIIIMASFLLLRVDRFITASVTSAAHASIKQGVSSRESGGKKVYFYRNRRAVLCKNKP